MLLIRLAVVASLFACPLAPTAHAAHPQGAPGGQGAPAPQGGSATPPKRAAPVKVDPVTLDLGYMTPRSHVSKTFTITNTSDQTLVVRAAAPSCTCTSVDIKGKTIPPHGSLEVPITMSVPAAPGLKSAQVNVAFQGYDVLTVLNMAGEVAYPVRLTAVDKGNRTNPFIDAHTDPTRTKGTFRAEAIDGQPFRVLGVLGTPPVFVGFDPATDAPRSSYDIAYDFSGVPCEDTPRFLLVETDRPDCRLVDMRIRHECTKITARIPFGEYRINAGAIPAGTVGRTDVHLKRVGAKRIVAVSSGDPEIAANVTGQTPDGDGLVVDLSLAVAPGARGLRAFPLTMTLLDAEKNLAATDSILVYAVIDPPAAAAEVAPSAAPATPAAP